MVANDVGRTLTTGLMSVQNYISLWRIVRTDGVTEYFTNHDESLTVPVLDTYSTSETGIDPTSVWLAPKTFNAAFGLTASASRREVGFKPESRTVLGFIDGISQTELEGGRYEMAEITEWIVDARWPALPWFQRNVFWIVSESYSETVFNFEMGGLGQRMQENFGHSFDRTCIWSLGRDDKGDPTKGCGQDRSAQTGGIKLDIDDFTYEGCVVSHVAEGIGTNARMSFNITTNSGTRKSATLPQAGPPSGRPYKYGSIIWTVGNNAGQEYDIADYTTDVAPFLATGQFSSYILMENPIVVGDECTIEEGCDNTFETCFAIYGNELNFGGWHLIPGPIRAAQPPRTF